jgi:hypothetical protein
MLRAEGIRTRKAGPRSNSENKSRRRRNNSGSKSSVPLFHNSDTPVVPVAC